MNRNAFTAAALAAATLTLGACGTAPESKPWPSSSAPASVSKAAAESTVAPAPRFDWLDVTGQGVELPRDTREHTMYSPEPIPGAKILHVINAADDMDACTVGPAVARGAQRGFLTAASCTNYSPLQYLQTLSGGGIQPWAEAVSPGADAAVIWSKRAASNVTRIADTWPIAGMLTAEGAYQLVPVGAPVCVNGATSGVVCGERMKDDRGLLQFRFDPGRQDAGAPVFVVDKATRSAVLIGIYQSDRKGRRGVAALDPTLGRLDARVVLDPGVKPLTGDGFSELVSTP